VLLEPRARLIVTDLERFSKRGVISQITSREFAFNYLAFFKHSGIAVRLTWAEVEDLSGAMIRTLILLALALAAYAEGPTFEVASIKPAPPREPGSIMPVHIGCSGGPGTNDPERWTCENMSLSALVRTTFALKPFQLQAMSIGNGDLFNVTAKVPEGTTKDQFRQMQQNLLIERFGLKCHREQKEMQGYELVTAKTGPKLKESEPLKGPAADPQVPSASSLTMGKDGFPVIPAGISGVLMGRGRGQWVRVTMEDFASGLSLTIGKAVTDGTGLKGKYDFSLQWAPEQVGNDTPLSPNVDSTMPPDSSDPSIFTALQEQLGLKLQPKKVTIEILVIDHIEKTPTEN